MYTLFCLSNKQISTTSKQFKHQIVHEPHQEERRGTKQRGHLPFICRQPYQSLSPSPPAASTTIVDQQRLALHYHIHVFTIIKRIFIIQGCASATNMHLQKTLYSICDQIYSSPMSIIAISSLCS